IVGGLLIAGAGKSMLNMPSAHLGDDPVQVTTYVAVDFLFAGVGVWMVVSWLRRDRDHSGGKLSKWPTKTLLILSIGWLLIAALGVTSYYLQKSKQESNKKFGSA